MKSLKDFVQESAEFTALDMRRMGKHLDMARRASEENAEHKGKIKARKDRIGYVDDQRYKDNQGVKWLDVKYRDNITLMSAALDGIIDSMVDDHIVSDAIIKQEIELYRSNNESDFKALCERHKETLDEILHFLNKYKGGETRVYRGYVLKQQDYLKYVKSSGKPSLEILSKIDNRTKEFNSFSVCPMIARGFAYDDSYIRSTVPVIISALVEPNDVYWAFTAYLMGRHRGCGEYELNINNLKELKDLRIIQDINKECIQYAKDILKVDKIQKELDEKKDPRKVFDKVKKADSYDKSIYDCRLGGFHVFVRNNKMITPFGMYIGEIKDGIYAIADTETDPENQTGNHWYIYKEGVGQIGKKYNHVNSHIKYNETENIMVYTDFKAGKMQLVNCVTGKELFNFPMANIQRAPGNLYSREKSPWHAEEYYLIRLPNKKYTVVNARGVCVIKTQLKFFDRIDFNLDKLEFDGIIDSNGNSYTFDMKNGSALLRVGW